MSIGSISACVAAALVFSCGGKKKDEEPAEGAQAAAAEHESAGPQATAASTLGRQAGSSAMGARKLAAEDNRKQLLAALDGWVQAQNTHDFDAYCSFYQTKGFQGIRRTSDKKSKKFDFDGWKRDRARMFKLKPKVAAEEPEVTSWLDPGAKLKVGVSEIRFMQRWQGGRYADHGTKVLRFTRDPAGKQRIIYEDLLNSEPGWERKASDDVETLAWEVPSDSAAALARWRELGVTGANYQDKLAALPADKAFRNKMAVALFEGGNFDCDAFVGEGDCGMLITADEMEINFLDDDRFEWAPLDPKAGFENPCLRRRLAIWAADYLEPADAKPLRKQVLALAALDAPEKELIDIAFRLAHGVGEDLLLEALAACRRADDLELADDHLRELSDRGLLHAASVLKIDMAAALLPAKKFHAAIGKLLAAEPSFGSSPFFLVGASSVSCDDKNLTCHAGPEEDRATFEFARADDGTLYLTSVDSSYYQPYGC